MTGRMREKFEQWVINNKGMHLLTLTDDQTETWIENPYCDPWTIGAYEAWKHLYPCRGGPRA